MSLDCPFYQELVKRNHPAAKWWRRGDLLYYIGLLPATVLFFPAAMAWQTLPADGGGWQVWVLYAFGLAVAVFVLGARLKAKSWRMAARDGIDVNDY